MLLDQAIAGPSVVETSDIPASKPWCQTKLDFLPKKRDRWTWGLSTSQPPPATRPATQSSIRSSPRLDSFSLRSPPPRASLWSDPHRDRMVGGREKPVTSVSLDDKFCEESSSDQSQPVNLVRTCNYLSPFGVESIDNYF